MKKFLITIFPFCVILFVSIWISCGLEVSLTIIGGLLFIVALSFGLAKWIDFVDKHIKD